MPPGVERGNWTRVVAQLTGKAMLHPSLACDLLRIAWRFRRQHWYARPPFLPIPDRAYVRWRMYTAYGDENAAPPVRDLVRYARWVGRFRQ